MDKELIKKFLRKENIFSVVGVSRDKKKYGYKIYKNLKEAGYRVYPINPNCDEIEGSRCYPSLDELPKKPEVVDIVVPPAVAEKVVTKCRELGIKKVWLQPGSESKKALDFCNENNMEVVYNVCVMLERKMIYSSNQNIKMDDEKRLKKEKLNKLMEENGNTANEVEINDSNFEKEVIERSKKMPVVVDFWASWCNPCLTLGPILEKAVKDSNGKVILAKANVDEAKTASQKYGIMSIPNVKLFKDGKVVDEFVGAYPEDFVKKWIEKNL